MSPERSLATLLEDIVHNVRDMVRSEIRLATTELKYEALKTRYALATVLVGLSILTLAAFTLIQAAIDALSLYMPAWGACLLLGVALVVAGAITCTVGVQRLSGIHKPERTVRTLRENVEWAKHHTR